MSEEKKTSHRDSMEKNMLNQFQSRLTTVNIFISAANERAGGISESSDKATSLFFSVLHQKRARRRAAQLGLYVNSINVV